MLSEKLIGESLANYYYDLHDLSDILSHNAPVTPASSNLGERLQKVG